MKAKTSVKSTRRTSRKLSRSSSALPNRGAGELSTLLPTAAEMASYDAAAMARGDGSLALMERAGQEMARRIRARSKGGRFVVLCGPGNNGGDGFVVARHLKKSGLRVSCVAVSGRAWSSECIENAHRFASMRGEILFYSRGTEAPPFSASVIGRGGIAELLGSADVVIDALLGTSQRSAPRELIGDIVHLVSDIRTSSPFSVVALDIPTGIDATTGEVFPTVISADRTLTVEMIKRGMSQYPAKLQCGEVEAVSIGISPTEPPRCRYLVLSDIPLPSRTPYSHKGSYGSVLVLGGSREMPGAPLLTSRAALRSGCGLVTRVAIEGAVVTGDFPECMVLPIDGRLGVLQEGHISLLREAIHRASSVVMGPGGGLREDTVRFFLGAMRERARKGAFLVDADGLNALAQGGEALWPDLRSAVLTPHPGEMGRLLGISTAEVERDRFGAAVLLAERTLSTVVLKGTATIIASPTQLRVCDEGTPYLATAGSGDVLAGIIASFQAQGLSNWDAACAGVWVHARAGRAALSERRGPLIASDIIEAISSQIGVPGEG